MAISPNGKTLYPMLEGALTTDPISGGSSSTSSTCDASRTPVASGSTVWSRRPRHRRSDRGDRRFPGDRAGQPQGAAARSRRSSWSISIEVDGDGFLVKHQVADLLQIAIRHNSAGTDRSSASRSRRSRASFRWQRATLGVLDDNNYPFSSGRVPGQPDPNEFIVIRLDRPIVD